MIEILTTSPQETKKVALLLVRELRGFNGKHAAVIALQGALGAGKTTFVQGFAKALGIRENVVSPTFVLMKMYTLPRRQMGEFRHLIHIDCYRLDSPKDLLHLGFEEIIKDQDAIVLIEWADRVRRILPRNTLWIRFRHGKRANERHIEI